METNKTLALLVTVVDNTSTYREGERRAQVTAKPVFMDASAEDGIKHPREYEGDEREFADLCQTIRVDSLNWITHEVEYCDCFRLTQYDIASMHKRMTAIHKAWSKKWEEDGSADSAGEFVLRFARVMGAKQIVIERSARSQEMTGARYCFESVAEGKATVNNQVWDIMNARAETAA